MRAREFIRHIFFFPFFRWEYGKWEILRREMQSDFLSNLSSMRRRSRSVRQEKKECTTEVYGEKLSWSSWMPAVRNNRKILSLLRIYYTMLSFKSIYSFFLSFIINHFKCLLQKYQAIYVHMYITRILIRFLPSLGWALNAYPFCIIDVCSDKITFENAMARRKLWRPEKDLLFISTFILK